MSLTPSSRCILRRESWLSIGTSMYNKWARNGTIWAAAAQKVNNSHALNTCASQVMPLSYARFIRNNSSMSTRAAWLAIDKIFNHIKDGTWFICKTNPFVQIYIDHRPTARLPSVQHLHTQLCQARKTKNYILSILHFEYLPQSYCYFYTYSVQVELHF